MSPTTSSSSSSPEPLAASSASPGAVPAPADSVRELEIDGEITLFHEPTNTALVLNATASDVWRLVDGTRSVDDIVALLSSSYETDAATVHSGVTSALAQLAQHHLLHTPAG